MVAVDQNGLDKKSVSEKCADVHSSPETFDASNLSRLATELSKDQSVLDENVTDATKLTQLLSYDPAPWYLRVPFCRTSAPSSKYTIESAPVLPEGSASIISRLFFEWVTDILRLGYSRPLQATDLYKLDESRHAKVIADKITTSFQRRLEIANTYNERLKNGQISPGILRSLWWSCRGDREGRIKKWREGGGRKKPSLVLALNDAVIWRFWSAGALKVIADSALMCTPLLVKAIIKFGEEAYLSRHGGDPNTDPPVGRGIGLAIGLLLLQAISFFGTGHFMYRAGTTGVLLRGGLITAIYNRSLHLSTRARSTLTNGKLVNHISTDVSRIDFACQFFHFMWTAPIMMILCLILLLINLGPSALAGYAFFLFLTPLLTMTMKMLFKLRKKSMVWTDKRAKLLQELLGGIKIIKFFAWELPFLKRIAEYRHHEIYYIRALLILRSANHAVAFTLPVFASVLSFVAWSLSGHRLDPAIIFSSLTLFQLLRLPLMFFPVAVSAVTDAANAASRLHDVFIAELLEEHLQPDAELKVAVKANSASFTWDSPPPESEDPKKKKKDKKGQKSLVVNQEQPGNKDDKVFTVKDIDLEIPRGSLVAVVGPVGSGKSSLLQGLIGEMRCTSGSVKFGGSVAYCPQTAWIQNASVRENVCFGRPFDEERYWRAVRDSCFERDLELLPHYDQTEVGEKGISLSGGQKQRLNICRAIYCNTDIQIFDDPLSALDAHVGKAVFQRVLQNNQEGKTRILVTHALHFLPYVDYIYVMLDGRVVERGRYSELMANNGAFAKFVQEFGNDENEDTGDKSQSESEVIEEDDKKRRQEVAGASLMQAEERVTGAVSGAVYAAYFRAGRGRIVLPLLILGLVMMQASSIMSSYWLVYWQESAFDIPQGAYMGIYAALGLSQAFWFFGSGAMFAFLSYFASKALHRQAIERVMHAPMSFFETTPLGRIMNRFAKDIDTIDNVLSDEMRMFANTFSQMIGAIVLLSIVVPWFLIAISSILVIYYYMALFYRSSARELKRLDSILRSSVYSHFSESLSGLATIRAYGETERFLGENERRIDIENRAYWLTVVNQHWLSIRLNCLGSLLTFIVAILTIATRYSISPAQTGVALSYIVLVQQSFAWMVRQSAEVENDMNGVERIVHYASRVEQESPHEVDYKPPTGWPSEGKVELRGIILKYRPELPPVLKGISLSIKGGEKIGIVGRTGAGKSSIMVALYRLVELSGGSIHIDDIDISELGLRDLRSSVAIIPQDPLLFSGTLRSNLDPFGLHDDARLWDALKRSYLVEDTKPTSLEYSTEDGSGSGAQTPVKRLTLDSPVEDEGSNLSVGQRSLVSLARALVKDSKVLVLDEATASVDYETDRNIQDTIAREFKDRTILCIAHRLRTIISYDRICVLDAGTIAEFETPSNLFQREDSIFRGMCNQSSITWEDIRLASKVRGEME